MTWKLGLGLSLHKSITRAHSLAQRHKLISRLTNALIRPTYSHKCKWSFAYFTSDYTYVRVYKHRKWQTHSHMSLHTNMPDTHTNWQVYKMQIYKCSLTLIHHNRHLATHRLPHVILTYMHLYPESSNLTKLYTCAPARENFTHPLLIVSL